MTNSTRWVVWTAGVGFPILCHGCHAFGIPQWPQWQDGEVGSVLSGMMIPVSAYGLYPIASYSMACLTIWACDGQPSAVSSTEITASGKLRGETKATSPWVLTGLLGGVPLSATLSIVWMTLWLPIRWGPGAPIAITVAAFVYYLVAIAVLALVYAVAGRWGQALKWINQMSPAAAVTLVVTTVVVSLLVIFNGAVQFVSLLFLIPVLLLGLFMLLAPAWTTMAYVAAAGQALRCPAARIGGRWSFGLADLVGWVTWAAVAIGSLRIVLKQSLQRYASLPDQPPPQTCYVATAAAGGHRWLVDDRQVRRLKAFEWWLRDVCPTGHRGLRQVYDRWGPPLAGRLDRAWKADVAYLTLKPAEYFAVVVLRWAGRSRNHH